MKPDQGFEFALKRGHKHDSQRLNYTAFDTVFHLHCHSQQYLPYTVAILVLSKQRRIKHIVLRPLHYSREHRQIEYYWPVDNPDRYGQYRLWLNPQSVWSCPAIMFDPPE